MSNKGANNIIRYKSTDGKIVNPYTVNFGVLLLSNTYINIGVMQFNKNVKYFGNQVFLRCTSLTNIEIPNSVTSIGNRAFFDCSSLVSIQIPNSVKSIGSEAFNGCTSLTSIKIPNNVTIIGNDAFSNCYNLTSIEIPNSVTSIGNRAFFDCSSLASVYVKPTTPPTLDTNDTNVFYNNASGRKIYVPRASLDAYKTARGWSKYADAIEPYDY